jgi:hypothetical protein
MLIYGNLKGNLIIFALPLKRICPEPAKSETQLGAGGMSQAVERLLSQRKAPVLPKKKKKACTSFCSNPSYSGGKVQEDSGSKPVRANSLETLS